MIEIGLLIPDYGVELCMYRFNTLLPHKVEASVMQRDPFHHVVFKKVHLNVVSIQ